MSLVLRDVEYHYERGTAAIRCAALAVPPGLTLLLGPNGCGKSTLLRMLAGVDRPHCGVIEIDGHDLWRDERAARASLAYIPEQPDVTPYATVREVLRLVADLRGEPGAAVDAALTRAGIEAVAARSVRELSMGQRRRVLLAAAWIGVPRTLLLDEPLETLDRSTRDALLAWLRACVEDGGTVVVVTHELDPFVAWAARVLTVRDAVPQLTAPLPADTGARARLLETVARGEALA